MKTDIVNKTKQSFELKEGNAGAYRFLKNLDAEAKVSIKVDPNATYREYVVATGKKGQSIFLTSDDFSEYKVIDIEEIAGEDSGTVIYKSVRRNRRKPGSAKTSKPSDVGGAGSKSKAEDGGSNAGVGTDPAASAPAEAGSVPSASAPAPVRLDPAASSAAEDGSVPPAPAPAPVRLAPPASSAAGVGSDPAASSAAEAGSVPPASAPAGAGSNRRALSVSSSKPPIGVSNPNERVTWFKKLKACF